jgi:aspartyl-tRNA(Asn)/glutamyl-tRNA(Gln) amidotransferase subunit A
MTLLTASATELRQHLLAREISATELLDATLQRIDAVNATINAVVATNPEAARSAAQESDRRIAAGEAARSRGCRSR